ncbi:hypothetical protein FH972_026254 [Carpinus fangiana]|uniref:RING-type E3 ubiquitin transferase n=1 Tax=Carpinus fangiana TaxID=176857 RepID=A0A5N6L3E7_9ROSI|nr:hypothetical protein FH972_026254 [Carpinus fangiana]
MARYNPRAIVVTIAILFFLFYPSGQPAAYAPSSSERARAAETIDRQWQSLATLNTSHYGDFVPFSVASEPEGEVHEPKWLNLTGFREADGLAWDLLPKAQETARALLEREAGQDGLDILDGKSGGVLHLYRNITGDIRGSWVRSSAEHDVTRPLVNLTAIAPDTTFATSSWERNITGHEGFLQMHFSEDESDEATTDHTTTVSAIMAIQDETSSGGGWDVALNGVHLVDHGGIILTTRSAKFEGMFGLPHFALSASQFELMQSNVNKSMSESLTKRRAELDSASSVELEMPIPKCEMVVYLQQHKIRQGQQDSTPDGLRDIEHELRFPSGSLQTAPPLVMSMSLFSPDCGFLLESKGPPDFPPQEATHLRGQKSEVYQRIIRNVLLAVSVLMSMQLWLLMQQMRISSTPSRQSKIAIRTLTMLAMGDYVVLLLASFLIPVVDTLFITLMVAIFFAIIGGSLIPNKFLLEIWNSQEPERVEALREIQRRYASERAEREARERENPSTTAAPTTTATARAASTLPPAAVNLTTTSMPLPLPVTSMRFTDATASALDTPTPPPAPIEPRLPTFGTLYTTNALLLLFIFFLTAVALTTFPQTLLYIYTRGLSLAYLSPWVPQIVRSVRHNTTRALSLRFVAGQSILRLIPFVWLWGNPESILPGRIFSYLGLGGGGTDVLNVQSDGGWVLVLAGWLWMQCICVGAQDILGARWFAWSGWPWLNSLPRAWDWSDVSRLRARSRSIPQSAGEEEASAGLLNSTTGGIGDDPQQPVIKVKSNDERTFECAICMQEVDVPIVGQTAVEVAGNALLGAVGGKRRDYMITPCGHVFHRGCLEGWMAYRLQCPICREGLPPL